MNEIENTLRSLLRSNIVAFTYRKVNGEIRHAIGTRNLTLASAYTNTRIPTPTGDMQPNSYYDVQSNGWRSWKTGYVISIDGYAEMPKRTAEIPMEKPVREIPISKPTAGGVSGGKTTGGADIDKLSGLLGGLLGGFGGGIPKEEIRKSMDKLDKDIDIVPLTMGGGNATEELDKEIDLALKAMDKLDKSATAHNPKIGTPVSGGKVGTPTFTDNGLELEMGIGVEDFAKMVAHYVVEEFISRIKSNI